MSLRLPLQRRFLPLSKIVDWHFWYYRNGANLTRSAKQSKLNPAAANEVDMGDCWKELDDLLRNDMEGLERKVRAKLQTRDFESLPQAVAYVETYGQKTQLASGRWRCIVIVNGCTVTAYGEQKPYAVTDAAQTLRQAFPHGD